jgi:hypothetical protein
MQFYFDWGLLEDGPYEVSFTFFSENITFNTPGVVLLKANIGSYVYGNGTGIAPFIGMITTCNSAIIGTRNYFTTSPMLPSNRENNKAYLQTKPGNNSFTIEILNTAQQPSPLFTATTSYELTLHFKSLKKRIK